MVKNYFFLGWAEPARWLKLVGPGCERGARWLLWLLSARDAEDPAVPRPHRALMDALHRQPFTLEEGKWRSGRFRALTSGLAEARSPGRAALPRLQPRFGTPGPSFFGGCRAVSLRDSFPSTLILVCQLLPTEHLLQLTKDHLQPEEWTSKEWTATLVALTPV